MSKKKATKKAKAKKTKTVARKRATVKATKQAGAAKRVSLLDAAAMVLADAKEPMSAKAIVEAVAAQGLWKSPGGKTPHATLYSAMTREVASKGPKSRFRKVDRGRFAAASRRRKLHT